MERLTILLDSAERPNVFHWWGRVDPVALDRWLESSGYRVPEGLLRLWRVAGGGDAFESETILSPFGDQSLGDSVDAVRELHIQKGMPQQFVPFHVGSGLSVFVKSGSGIRVLDRDDYRERRRFKDFDSWYRGHLRVLFADRYGLPDSVPGAKEIPGAR